MGMREASLASMGVEPEKRPAPGEIFPSLEDMQLIDREENGDPRDSLYQMSAMLSGR